MASLLQQYQGLLILIIVIIGNSLGLENTKEIKEAFQKIMQQMKENEVMQLYKNGTSTTNHKELILEVEEETYQANEEEFKINGDGATEVPHDISWSLVVHNRLSTDVEF
ncbi:hypothetical protein K1T71_006639 [Dendrolimus kikuchii]|uniref:Uncharacterized protein n=1 Tax=Dendrolimus kikuchii TaxID=765133 RepID=A0ACC1D1D9_9NEOP|nr:hypothetical protein K1T71_006639 [Dendrolimus kikuchii]